jgi:hypothetical protein
MWFASMIFGQHPSLCTAGGACTLHVLLSIKSGTAVMINANIADFNHMCVSFADLDHIKLTFVSPAERCSALYSTLPLTTICHVAISQQTMLHYARPPNWFTHMFQWH